MKNKIMNFLDTTVVLVLGLGFTVLSIILFVKSIKTGIDYFDGSVLKFIFYGKHVFDLKYTFQVLGSFICSVMGLCFLNTLGTSRRKK